MQLFKRLSLTLPLLLGLTLVGCGGDDDDNGGGGGVIDPPRQTDFDDFVRDLFADTADDGDPVEINGLEFEFDDNEVFDNLL